MLTFFLQSFFIFNRFVRRWWNETPVHFGGRLLYFFPPLDWLISFLSVCFLLLISCIQTIYCHRKTNASVNIYYCAHHFAYLHERWNTCPCFHRPVLSFETLLSIIIDLYSNTAHFSILSLSNYHVSSDSLMSRRLIPAIGLFSDNEIFPHLPSINR